MEKRQVMRRCGAVTARIAIFVFAAATAFYSLCVSAMGRLNVEMGNPGGLLGSMAELASSAGHPGIAEMISRVRTGDIFLATLLFAGICFLGEICFQGEKREKLRRYVLKGMFPVLLIIAAVWILLRLNNTSLFAWNEDLKGNQGYPLFGTARGIRRDEFVLWTPMALSQQYIGWPAVNTLIGNGTDVTWISMGGLPAWNAALIFKPLYWGFLIFGADYGLSILCIGRLLLLFLVSWKTAMLYTKRNRGMSIAAAVILTLSPMVQWFISQSIAEVLIFGQGMILATHGLIHSDSTKKQILLALLNGWLLGCLVLIGYPAWIIPVVYLVLAVGIWMFTRPAVSNRRGKARSLVLGMLPSLAMLGVVVYFSWDTLQAVQNSVYPGSRLITGGLFEKSTGNTWNSCFQVGLASIFTPLDKMEYYSSNCVDTAPFLGFAPAGLVLTVEHWRQRKKADSVSVAVMAVMVIFWGFTFVKLPAWLCKIALLSQCSRPVFPIGICEVILLIRGRAEGGIRKPKMAVLAAVLSTALNIVCIICFDVVRPSVVQIIFLTALYLFAFLMIYLDFHGSGRRLMIFFLCCILLLAGGFVNPVQQGLEMLNDFEFISVLRSIENEPEDLYVMEDGYPIDGAVLLAGKHCINTDQPYADMERWAAVDPEGKFQEAYNRLCHIEVILLDSDEGTNFVPDGNYLFVYLTRDDLAKLGVNYLITYRTDVENATLVAVAEKNHLYIWKLE